jgi:hypothetical protein
MSCIAKKTMQLKVMELSARWTRIISVTQAFTDLIVRSVNAEFAFCRLSERAGSTDGFTFRSMQRRSTVVTSTDYGPIAT